jgi:hypothetical protein
MKLSENLIDKIKKECENIRYGNIVVNISPNNVIVEVTKRLLVTDDSRICPNNGKKMPE